MSYSNMLVLLGGMLRDCNDICFVGSHDPFNGLKIACGIDANAAGRFCVYCVTNGNKNEMLSLWPSCPARSPTTQHSAALPNQL